MLAEEYFVRQFRTCFNRFKNKKIILYGMSIRTEYILRSFPEYKFVGIMGAEKTEGYFHNIPILSQERVIESGAEVIIIVARDQNIPIIANRLIHFWNENNIQIYSITGRNVYDYNDVNMPVKMENQLKKKQPVLWNQLCNSKYRGLTYLETNEYEKNMIHLFAKRVFANLPLEQMTERVEISNLKEFSYCFIAPMITTFVFFIIQQLQDGKYDKVLFAARDCYLIQKLYHMAKEHYKLSNLPEDIYFQTSRMACIVAATSDEEDFFFQDTLPCAYDQKYMTYYRYQVEMKELDEDSKEKYPTTYDYLVAHKELIFHNSKILRDNYVKYIRKQGIKKGDRCAFVDLVSSGTCQLMLQKFVDFTLKGIYLGRYEIDGAPERKMMPITSLYQRWNINEKNDWETYYIFEHYWFIETVMTSNMPSLHYFNKDGVPIFCNEKRTDKDIAALEEMQTGIIDFFRDFIHLSDSSVPMVSPLLPDMIYRYSSGEYTIVNCEYFRNQTLYEDLGLGVLDAKGK